MRAARFARPPEHAQHRSEKHGACVVNPVVRIVARRLRNAVPVLAIVVIGSYGLLALAPGDAVDAYFYCVT